jgi:hypothetical protein
MMEAVRTSETSVDNHFTRQYNPEASSEHHSHCLFLEAYEIHKYTVQKEKACGICSYHWDLKG